MPSAMVVPLTLRFSTVAVPVVPSLEFVSSTVVAATAWPASRYTRNTAPEVASSA